MKIGYACGVDYQHHLDDPEGLRVFGSVEDVKRAYSDCYNQCGIVELELVVAYWPVRQDFLSERTESRVDKAKRRKDLSCSFCPPNKGENAKRKPKADKYKTKRRGKR